MLSPRAIALQGIGFGALLVAVQGFGSVSSPPAPPPTEITTPAPQYYSASLDAMQALRRQQLEEDEVILAIIQQFVLEA